ncbi:MAG: hypothetical protein ACRC14_04155, partial [Paracoccaceae bacterium]
EETGVAQYYRDARILPIYEGTNGIQAIDLVSRKLGLEHGATLEAALHACQNALGRLVGEQKAASVVSDMRGLSVVLLAAKGSPTALACATPFAEALATLVAAGYLAEATPLARDTELQGEAETDAQWYFASAVPCAIAMAKAAMVASEVVAKVSSGLLLRA